MMNVVCVKAKPHYDYKWVNRLHRNVKRNLTVPHRFMCFTDDSSGITCTTKHLPKGLKGWWAKLSLFRSGLFEGLTLYLDLDTLVTRNIDFLSEYQGDFAILRDFYRPEGYGSGVMLFNKVPTQVWDNWIKRPVDHILGDQGWIETQVSNADRVQDLFPEKVVSYKVHCENGLPEKAALVCFHGIPKCDDFPESHWVYKEWATNSPSL